MKQLLHAPDLWSHKPSVLPRMDRPFTHASSTSVAPPTASTQIMDEEPAFKPPMVITKVTSGMGQRSAPEKGASTDHKGIDLGGRAVLKINKPEVYAVAPMVIIHSGELPKLGQVVIGMTQKGTLVLYGHLVTRYVSEGQIVDTGSLLGKIGEEDEKGEKRTGPSLHFATLRPQTSGKLKGQLAYEDPKKFFLEPRERQGQSFKMMPTGLSGGLLARINTVKQDYPEVNQWLNGENVPELLASNSLDKIPSENASLANSSEIASYATSQGTRPGKATQPLIRGLGKRSPIPPPESGLSYGASSPTTAKPPGVSPELDESEMFLLFTWTPDNQREQ